MILSSEYQINKISREIKAGEAKIKGVITHEKRMYVIVERLDLWRTDHVPQWLAPAEWISRGVR